MMKKMSGFTLAEVLITLGIIGVIAALTIPSLVRNIQDIQYKNQWRNTFTELSEAYKQMITDNQFQIGGLCTGNGNPGDDNCFKDELKKYIKVANSCNETGASGPNTCLSSMPVRWLSGSLDPDPGGNSPGPLNGSGAGIIMVNGAMLSISWGGFDHGPCITPPTTPKVNYWDPPFIPYCSFGDIEIDTNGSAAPNQVGKDVFFIKLSDTGIIPLGQAGDSSDSWRDGPGGSACDLTVDSEAYGYTCASDYLHSK